MPKSHLVTDRRQLLEFRTLRWDKGTNCNLLSQKQTLSVWVHNPSPHLGKHKEEPPALATPAESTHRLLHPSWNTKKVGPELRLHDCQGLCPPCLVKTRCKDIFIP